MEDAKIILESGNQADVKGIFYVFDSKYYFMYTMCETLDNDYTQLYIVQVFKETQNTQNGIVDTGYLVGVEFANQDEWAKAQQSITKIVQDKKSGSASPEIQYLPMNMLTNLKITSHNKFKLMTKLLNDSFNLNILPNTNEPEQIQPETQEGTNNTEAEVDAKVDTSLNTVDNSAESGDSMVSNEQNDTDEGIDNDIIIDYRAKFFEEQDKNNELQEKVTLLEEKLNNIKAILE